MSLQSRLSDLITQLGTDYKFLRSMITGSSTGTLSSLTTTDKTSIIAAINETKAGNSGSPPDATETVKGIVELATQAELTTGTDDVRAVTPLKHVVDGNARWQAKSANLLALAGYTVDNNSALGSGTTVLPTQAAVKGYADALIDAANGMQYKGVIDASANPNYPAASAGWFYRISVAGKIGGASGVNVEVGDTVLCLVDSSAAGNQATVGSNWNISQTNVDGAVVGPASSTASDFATFSGTSGKVIQDSGVALDTDGTMAANSNVKIPSQAATRTYIGTTNYTKTELGNPETDLVALYTTAKA